MSSKIAVLIVFSDLRKLYFKPDAEKEEEHGRRSNGKTSCKEALAGTQARDRDGGSEGASFKAHAGSTQGRCGEGCGSPMGKASKGSEAY